MAHAKLNDVETYADDDRVVQSMCCTASAYVGVGGLRNGDGEELWEEKVEEAKSDSKRGPMK